MILGSMWSVLSDDAQLLAQFYLQRYVTEMNQGVDLEVHYHLDLHRALFLLLGLHSEHVVSVDPRHAYLIEALILKANQLTDYSKEWTHKDHPAALSFLSSALFIHSKGDNRNSPPQISREMYLLQGIGLLQAALGQPEEAVASLELALAVSKLNVLTTVQARTELTLHTAFAQLNVCQWEKAKNLFEYVVAHSSDSALIIKATGALSLMQLLGGDPESALKLANTVIIQYASAGDIFTSLSMSRLLVLQGKCFLHMGRFWEARLSFLGAVQQLHSDAWSITAELESRKQRHMATAWLRRSCHMLVLDISNHSPNLSHDTHYFHAAIASDDFNHQLCMDTKLDDSDPAGKRLNNPQQYEQRAIIEPRLVDYLKQTYRLVCLGLFSSSSRCGKDYADVPSWRCCADKRQVAALGVVSLQIYTTLICITGSEQSSCCRNCNQSLPLKICELSSLTSATIELDVTLNKCAHLCQLYREHKRESLVHLLDISLAWSSVTALEPVLSSLRDVHEVPHSSFIDTSIGDGCSGLDCKTLGRTSLGELIIPFVENGAVIVEHRAWMRRIFAYCRRYLLKQGYFKPNVCAASEDSICRTGSAHPLLFEHHHDRARISNATTFEELVSVVNSSFHVPFLSKSSGNYTIWELHVELDSTLESEFPLSTASMLSVYISLGSSSTHRNCTKCERSTVLQKALGEVFNDFRNQLAADISGNEYYIRSRSSRSKLSQLSLLVFYYWVHLSPFRTLQQNDFFGAAWLQACANFCAGSGFHNALKPSPASAHYPDLYMEALLSSTPQKFLSRAQSWHAWCVSMKIQRSDDHGPSDDHGEKVTYSSLINIAEDLCKPETSSLAFKSMFLFNASTLIGGDGNCNRMTSGEGVSLDKFESNLPVSSVFSGGILSPGQSSNESSDVLLHSPRVLVRQGLMSSEHGRDFVSRPLHYPTITDLSKESDDFQNVAVSTMCVGQSYNCSSSSRKGVTPTENITSTIQINVPDVEVHSYEYDYYYYCDCYCYDDDISDDGNIERNSCCSEERDMDSGECCDCDLFSGEVESYDYYYHNQIDDSDRCIGHDHFCNALNNDLCFDSCHCFNEDWDVYSHCNEKIVWHEDSGPTNADSDLMQKVKCDNDDEVFVCEDGDDYYWLYFDDSI